MSAYLFGQLSDPNTKVLYPHFDKFIDQAANIEWNVTEDVLYVEGQPVTDLDSIFVRNNVFEESTHKKYNNYYIIQDYLQYHNITRYNKNHHYEKTTKLHNLLLAKELGLRIPYTEASEKSTRDNSIIKPVLGGQHTLDGNEASYPCIIQQKITGKNKRLYVINNKHFSFEVVTDKLDYRDDPESTVVVTEIDDVTVEKVKHLMCRLNLDFGASDFMEDEEGLWFLEVNTGPMFVAFDMQVQGKLAETIRYELNNI